MNKFDSMLKNGVTTFDIDIEILNQWQGIIDSLTKIMNVPSALIMRLNDKNIEVFRSNLSEGNPYKLLDSEKFFNSGLYCETVIRTNEPLEVPNALKDDQWKDNPDVELNLISYLGFPIMAPNNTPFGTLCLLDNQEHHFSKEEKYILLQFKNMLESHLKLIKTTEETLALKIRTQELENNEKQLRLSKQGIEAANSAKSDFLANLSHELLTPMNVIIGFSKMALNTKLSLEQKKHINSISKSADSLHIIIKNVLDFSKIKAGELEIFLNNVSFEKTLHDFSQQYITKAENKNLVFSLEIGNDVPKAIKADELRLIQILDCLCDNAIKFTEFGSICLKVSTVSRSERSLILKFSIIDTGISLSSDQISNLFQPFTQGDASSTRKYGGIGLGLAMSKKLVTLMFGDIGVTKNKEMGLTFWFTGVFETADKDYIIEDITKNKKEVINTGHQLKNISSEIDYQLLSPLFSKLLESLEDDDSDSIDILENIINTIAGTPLCLELNKLIAPLSGYDFEEGIRLLKVIIETNPKINL